MHAITAIADPGRQGRIAHCLAGGNVFGNPLRHLLPAGCLPGFKRAQFPAVTPADREIDVACGIGDIAEVERRVMEKIAEHGPEELRLLVRRGAQRGEFFRGIPDREYLADFLTGPFRGRAVILSGQVQHLDVLADLAEEAGTGLLPECTLFNQRAEPGRCLEVRVPGIIREGVIHGLDHMRHGVEADDIGGAVGRALRAANGRPGDRVDRIEAELELLGVVHGGEDGEHADAVANEIRRVLGEDDALAEGRGEEGFQPGKQGRIGLPIRNQLDQVHVARRVEEVDAGEARAHGRRQSLGEGIDGKARSVAGNESRIRHMRRNLLVKIELPVEAFGNRFDDQVAALEQVQVLVVVGRCNRSCARGFGQRRR